jgi:hypothetical protein
MLGVMRSAPAKDCFNPCGIPIAICARRGNRQANEAGILGKNIFGTDLIDIGYFRRGP